jgi:hypothetical protein
LVVSLLAYFVERKLAFSAYSFAWAHNGKKREVNIKRVVLRKIGGREIGEIGGRS